MNSTAWLCHLVSVLYFSNFGLFINFLKFSKSLVSILVTNLLYLLFLKFKFVEIFLGLTFSYFKRYSHKVVGKGFNIAPYLIFCKEKIINILKIILKLIIYLFLN